MTAAMDMALTGQMQEGQLVGLYGDDIDEFARLYDASHEIAETLVAGDNEVGSAGQSSFVETHCPDKVEVEGDTRKSNRLGRQVGITKLVAWGMTTVGVCFGSGDVSGATSALESGSGQALKVGGASGAVGSNAFLATTNTLEGIAKRFPSLKKPVNYLLRDPLRNASIAMAVSGTALLAGALASNGDICEACQNLASAVVDLIHSSGAENIPEQLASGIANVTSNALPDVVSATEQLTSEGIDLATNMCEDITLQTGGAVEQLTSEGVPSWQELNPQGASGVEQVLAAGANAASEIWNGTTPQAARGGIQAVSHTAIAFGKKDGVMGIIRTAAAGGLGVAHLGTGIEGGENVGDAVQEGMEGGFSQEIVQEAGVEGLAAVAGVMLFGANARLMYGVGKERWDARKSNSNKSEEGPAM